MGRISRYLFVHLVVTVLISTVTITASIVIIQSLRLIELMITTNASFFLFLKLISLTIPTFLGVLLPITVSGSILFTYNKKILDSELVILSSSGLGPWQLAVPALVLALVVTAGSFYLSLYGRSFSHRALRDLKETIVTDVTSVLIHEGTLIDLVDGVTLYVHDLHRSGQMSHIMIHDRRSAEQETTLIAARGILDYTPHGLRLILEQGLRQEMHHVTNRWSELYFDRYVVTLRLVETDRVSRSPKLRELSIDALLAPPIEVLNDPQAKNRYNAELHMRISTPLLTLTFSFIALATVFTGQCTPRDQGWRLIIGGVIIACFKVMSLGLISLSTKHLMVLPLIYFCYSIPIVIASWMMSVGESRSFRRS